jgi:hypothetical protein
MPNVYGDFGTRLVYLSAALYKALTSAKTDPDGDFLFSHCCSTYRAPKSSLGLCKSFEDFLRMIQDSGKRRLRPAVVFPS